LLFPEPLAVLRRLSGATASVLPGRQSGFAFVYGTFCKTTITLQKELDAFPSANFANRANVSSHVCLLFKRAAVWAGDTRRGESASHPEWK
jgi:hypothetical protein